MRRPGEGEQVPGQVRRRRGTEALGRRRGDRDLVLGVERRPEAVEGRLRGARLGLAERGEPRRDARSDAVDLAQERIGPFVAQRARDALHHRGVARHAVGLLAGRELDAVLEAAEKEVRVRQLPLLALGDEAARPQATQRLDGVGAADARLAPAPDELEALREELDLADPARADLQVVLHAEPRLRAGPRQHATPSRRRRSD